MSRLDDKFSRIEDACIDLGAELAHQAFMEHGAIVADLNSKVLRDWFGFNEIDKSHCLYKMIFVGYENYNVAVESDLAKK